VEERRFERRWKPSGTMRKTKQAASVERTISELMCDAS
jgi:hypothetical protein